MTHPSFPMRRSRRVTSPHGLTALVTLAALVVATGCGDAVPDTPARDWTTTLSTAGDTVVARTTGALPDSGTHRLTEVWRVGDVSGVDTTVTFGQISGFAVRGDNTVAVFDISGPDAATLRLRRPLRAHPRPQGRRPR